MKFIHLTDPHLTASGERFGIDVAGRLGRAVDDINANHADAELCMITGDVAHWAEPEAYVIARRAFARLAIPWHLLLGNHDRRDPFAAAFPETPRDDAGFFQYALDTSAGRFLILDTCRDDGKSGGVLCEHRLRWLRDRLAEAGPGRDVYLFLHHHPMASRINGLDRIALANGKDLAMTLKGFRNVRHMFLGHLHRPMHGSWKGIPFSTTKATAHQVAAVFDPDARLTARRALPAYGVVFIDADGVVAHDISYEEADLAFTCDRNTGKT